MKIIKNSKELAKLVNKDKDLFLKDEDVRIEFEPSREELRDVSCKDLFMMNDYERFNFNGGNFNGGDFNGGDFNGWNFNGWNFKGWDFNGGDFNGRNFNGGDFNGRNFNGKKVSYWAFFNCYNSIRCESIEGKREPHAEPVSLIGKIEIIKPQKIGKRVKIKVADGQILEGEIVA